MAAWQLSHIWRQICSWHLFKPLQGHHWCRFCIERCVNTCKPVRLTQSSHQHGPQHCCSTPTVGYCRCVHLVWLEVSHACCIGQERFGNMTRVYYKEAVGAFIVFDVTRVSTFEAVQKWKADIDNKVEGISTVTVAHSWVRSFSLTTSQSLWYCWPTSVTLPRRVLSRTHNRWTNTVKRRSVADPAPSC